MVRRVGMFFSACGLDYTKYLVRMRYIISVWRHTDGR